MTPEIPQEETQKKNTQTDNEIQGTPQDQTDAFLRITEDKDAEKKEPTIGEIIYRRMIE